MYLSVLEGCSTVQLNFILIRNMLRKYLKSEAYYKAKRIINGTYKLSGFGALKKGCVVYRVLYTVLYGIYICVCVCIGVCV